MKAKPVISFKEKMEYSHNLLYLKSKKFNRTQTANLIGFSKKRGAFTEFLNTNYFLCGSDYPNPYLLEKKLMFCQFKPIKRRQEYDKWGCEIEWDERSNDQIIKTVYVPLFTESGVKYMKRIISEQDFFGAELVKLHENYINPLK